jgi:opacity protein-like surface antigen
MAEGKMTKTSGLLRTSVACFLAAACSAAVGAAEPTAHEGDASQGAGATTAAAEAPFAQPPKDEWEFIVTPYLWAASSKSQFTTRQGESVTAKNSFFDVLGDLKFAFMSGAQVRHGRLVLTSDIMYMNLGTSGSGSVGPVPLEASVDLKLLIMTALGGYRVVDQGPMFVDLMAGMRHVSVKTDLELTGPFVTRERSPSASHFGPVLAVRGRVPLGGKFGLYGYGDVGGFGIGSAKSWQLMATVQYDISQHWQLGGGWRHLYARGKENGFELRQNLDGPIFTVSHRF